MLELQQCGSTNFARTEGNDIVLTSRKARKISFREPDMLPEHFSFSGLKDAMLV